MKKLLVLGAVAAAAAVFPTVALAGSFGGVVVGRGAGSVAVASKSGLVRTVHTRAHPRVGARVTVSGTRVRVVGMAHRARIHAVVVSRARRTTFLAASRSLLAVRASSSRRFASVAQSPAPGAVVNTTVSIAQGQMTEQTTQVVGQTGKVTVQAPVTAVGAGTITVTVNGQPLVINLPAGLQLPASLVGQSVTLTVTLVGGNPVAQPGKDDDDDNENEDDEDDDDGSHDDHGGHGHEGDD
jgi:hypothetical protein